MTRRMLLALFGPKWADTTRLGRPYAKDPSVIEFANKYWLYYSTPTVEANRQLSQWTIGIATSTDLENWTKIGEVPPAADYEAKGLCAPCAKVIRGQVHIFYQTYGNGAKDAICHATSPDGIHFTRNPTNPIFHPTGAWTAGRAIDADVILHNNRWLLYAATRDPAMKIQMITGAYAPADTNFNRETWTQLANGPLLQPDLPWERDCIEAPSVIQRGRDLYMFYAGGYNNAPQQIGCTKSRDGVTWQRLFQEPLLAAGKPGEWNSSESGHPGVFVTAKGETVLFYQGNNDKGRTWYLSQTKIGWRRGLPYVIAAKKG